MRRTGIYFDHEEEYRQAWLHYAVASVTIGLVQIINHAWNNIDGKFDFRLLGFLRAFAIDVLQVATSMMISTSFSIMLTNIHNRFTLLNSVLRYFFYSTFSFHPFVLVFLLMSCCILFSSLVQKSFFTKK